MSEFIQDYIIDVEWEEGRAGKITAPGISQSVIAATPPEFEGGVEGIMSPEHLFVASVSSCYMTTFLAIAHNSDLKFKSLSIKASGSLEKENGKYKMAKITLNPTLILEDESKKDKAMRILEKSDAACLISRSINSEIELNPQIEIQNKRKQSDVLSF